MLSQGVTNCDSSVETMIRISVKADISGMVEKFNAARDQVPYATAKALTETAKYTKEKLRAGMSDSFQSVTGYTKNSLLVKWATKTDLCAEINVKGGATGAVKWLKPEIFGGHRQRAIELILASAGLPPTGMYAVPGKNAKKGAGGKIDIAWLQSLMGAILVQGQSGITVSQTKRRNLKRGGASQYFVLKTKWGKLGPGIYGKKGNAVYPFVMFIREPTYRARYDFYGIATAAATQRFPVEFSIAIQKAMASRR